MTRRIHKAEGETAGRQVLVNLDEDLIEWFDREALLRDRSRTWLINHVCKMYRKQLEYERRRRREKRSAAALGKGVK